MKKHDKDTKQSRWLILAVTLGMASGFIGCETTGGEAPMTNAYGDPIGSTEDKQMEMEDQMEEVTQSLTP